MNAPEYLPLPDTQSLPDVRELPIERASKFQFILNLRAAKALGLELPTATLLRAEEVIE